MLRLGARSGPAPGPGVAAGAPGQPGDQPCSGGPNGILMFSSEGGGRWWWWGATDRGLGEGVSLLSQLITFTQKREEVE